MNTKRTFLLAIILIINALIMDAQEVSMFPYIENFGGGSGGFVASGPEERWKLLPLAGENNSTGWKFSETKVEYQNETYYVESPIYDFSELTTDPYLFFSANFSLEVSYGDVLDGHEFFVEVSVDGGKTYSLLGSQEDDNWYNDDDGFEGKTDWYETFGHQLNGTAGHKVRLRFGVTLDGLGLSQYLAFDNVQITLSEEPISPHSVAISLGIDSLSLVSALQAPVIEKPRTLKDSSSKKISDRYLIGKGKHQLSLPDTIVQKMASVLKTSINKPEAEHIESDLPLWIREYIKGTARELYKHSDERAYAGNWFLKPNLLTFAWTYPISDPYNPENRFLFILPLEWVEDHWVNRKLQLIQLD